MKKKVTIRDVAYIAGVSISTVSRVVSGQLNVSDSTLQRVNDAIAKTGYQPNYTARALATNSTDTIAVIIDRSPTQGFGNSFFLDALSGIAKKLNSYRKDMILIFEDQIDTLNITLKRIINSKKIDAVIKLTVQKEDTVLYYLEKSDTPTVVVGRVENYNVKTVNNDNVNAMKKATEHLICSGCKNIAFVGGNPEYVVTVDRLEGYKKALYDSNIDFSKENIFYTDFSIDAGKSIAPELISNKFDGIVCTDDLIAYGISKEYDEKNKQIKMVSFNNTYLSQMANTPFSSVDINAFELGEKAVELLYNGFIEDNHLLVDTKLINRG